MSTENIGGGVEIHGVGNHDLPDTTSPEQFVDRYNHQQTYNAILLIESQLINAVPELGSDGSFTRVEVKAAIVGNTAAAVKQRYLDVGWRHVDIIAHDDIVKTSVVLWFPI